MATYGPEDATLTVHTKRAGAAAKAGHDLTILVERWSATYEDGTLDFEADPRSLRVLKGEGGIGTLGDEEKAGIKETLEDEILDGSPITYRGGELTLNGVTHPVAFTFDGTEGRAEVKQTDFKIKPYSALFGTLKVADVVEVKVRTNG
ncbi:YceI family protein [Solirubrobacter phytolaccae]|uniref:YceI family protein n=1 Tax=Solirubrobacter phytolaccae TaxID=1404360 RepID=A0A9X3NAT1_9ACTN|nr:YceI family protein [Solirubrobacter phytolaccae]MDA0179277.1 YceI family protein [Solirubrobacter phytolaccae]